nr:nitrile hydratase accessory protein [uncultured Gellertiella sp.]
MSACETLSPLTRSPGLPVSPEGAPVFAEPWHATAFALTVHLHGQDLFSWAEWAAALSAEVKKPGRAEDGSDYFDAWVDALAGLLAARGIADAQTILSLQKSWQRAAGATPHGFPVLIENDPARA